MPLSLVILKAIVEEVVYMPVWWYTVGAGRATKRFFARLKDGNDYLGWSIWLVNIFTPMYGQSDLAGRLISVTMRLVQVIARSILLLAWVIVAFIMYAVYFILPIIAVGQIAHHWRLALFY